jgi:O-antigen ligase
VLLATLAIAMLWADAPWPRRFAEWWSWRPLILLLVAQTLFDDDRAKDRYCLALVLLLGAAALASFLVLLLPDPVVIDDPGVILRNHTTQGMAFVVGILLAAMLAWGRPLSPRLRLLVWACLALFIANLALVATGRSAHVALVAASAVATLSLVQGRRRWAIAVAIPVAAVLLLGSSTMVRERFEKISSEVDTVATAPTETSSGLRIIIWSTTRDLILAHPWLGYGTGGFAPAYAQLIHQRYTGWQAAEAKDTHNQYLRVVVDAGVPGALALLVFIAGVLRHPARPPYRGAGLALFCAWLVTCLFNSHFQTFDEAHLAGLALGVLLAGVQARDSKVATVALATS